jgi:hypothetical protein
MFSWSCSLSKPQPKACLTFLKPTSLQWRKSC